VHLLHERQEAATRRRTETVDITLLGDFRVAVDGLSTQQRGWARRSAAALVKILALTPGHQLHRERVMDLLWPEEALEVSAPRLHKAAHFARKATGRDDAVVLRDDVVSLFPDAAISVDVLRFEELARIAVADQDHEAARQALAAYGGDLLPGDSYEDWAADRRELLALRRLDVLRVAGAWREVTELAPIDEEAHTEVIGRHLAAGDPQAALRQYEHLERVLERELGATPGERAQRARREAQDLLAHGCRPASRRADAVLNELAELMRRQQTLLRELSATGMDLRPLFAVPVR
jgi:DNA-binding SARP family transcriptional activator